MRYSAHFSDENSGSFTLNFQVKRLIWVFLLNQRHTKKDSRLVALSINDKENKHAIMRIHESIRRCVHTHQTAPDSYQNALKMALAQVHAMSQSAVQSRLANS